MAKETTPAGPAVVASGPEKAFLVAVDTGEEEGWTAEESLKELAALAEAAGAVVVGRMWQKRTLAHPNTYLGKGKLQELVEAKEETGFDLLIADDELSPRQQRSFENLLGIKVLDRSGLILDIFAQRAQTAEGRLQVELAQLQYQLPRLTRLWAHLSRMGGGIGTRRGPGEQQLETDRRVVRQRIANLRERVEGVRQRRETAARARDRRLIPSVSLVGYTNAGKSTLLNALVGEEVAAVEDMLFATLDPTSRRVGMGDGQVIIATDTVGFIHKLPHQLIDAFRATLEEVTRADVLLIVVDASDPHAPEHLSTVTSVLDELGAGHTPRIIVCNKVDLVGQEQQGVAGGCAGLPVREARSAVAVSALRGEGLEALRGRLMAVLADLWVDVDTILPYSAGDLLARVRERGTVEFEYRDRDVRVRGRVPPALAGALDKAGSAWHRALRIRDRVDDE